MVFQGSVVPEGVSSSDGIVYVGEFGATRSYIGIINVVSNGENCSSKQSSASLPSTPMPGLADYSHAIFPERTWRRGG